MSAAVDAILERVKGAPAAEVDAAVTTADVSALCDLDDVTREVAVRKLAGLKVSTRLLRQRIKEEIARRALESRPRLDGWRADMRRNRDGDVYPSFDNLCSVFRHEWEDRLSYDLMSHRAHVDGAALDDVGLSRVRAEVCRAWGASWGKEDVADAAAMIGRELRAFHPVADHLHGLKWDEQPRLWTAARDLLGLPDPLSNVMLGRTLIASVARALVHEHAPTRGTKVKTVLIVLGYQDAKKSTLFEELGGDYYGSPSKVDVSSNKFLMTMGGLWWAELPEIDGLLTRSSNEETKAWSALRADDYVPMYGRSPIHHVRSWIPVGTTNRDKILTDPTGSNRWWILDIRRNGPDFVIDPYKVRAVRDHLLAEATACFARYLEEQRAGVRDDENPYRWWLNREEEKARAHAAGAYEVENPWTADVGAWLAGQPIACPHCRGTRMEHCVCISGKVTRGALPQDGDGREYVTCALVLREALGIPAERLHQHAGKIATTLNDCGWTAGKRFPKGGPTPYYPTPTDEERHLAAGAEGDGRDAEGRHVDLEAQT